MVWSAFNIYFILYTSLYKLFYFFMFSLYSDIVLQLNISHSSITRPRSIFTSCFKYSILSYFCRQTLNFQVFINNIFPDKQSFVCHSLTVYLLPNIEVGQTYSFRKKQWCCHVDNPVASAFNSSHRAKLALFRWGGGGGRMGGGRVELQDIICKIKNINLFFKPMIKIIIRYHISGNLDSCILKYIIVHIFLFSNKSYTTLTIY